MRTRGIPPAHTRQIIQSTVIFACSHLTYKNLFSTDGNKLTNKLLSFLSANF